MSFYPCRRRRIQPGSETDVGPGPSFCVSGQSRTAVQTLAVAPEWHPNGVPDVYPTGSRTNSDPHKHRFIAFRQYM